MSQLNKYMSEVFTELEKFNYPELIQEYDEYDVSESIAHTVVTSFRNGVSARMAAIVIWSLTMNYQIIPSARESVKH